jgi:uncharacterized protein (TIGR02284 family)
MNNLNDENTIHKLNHLIDIAEDGKEGYESAAERIEDPQIKSSFLLFSQDRSLYASKLRQIVQELNGDSEDKGGNALGSLHRVWIDLKSILTSGDTTAIVNACITGEESAIKEYKMVLNDDEVPNSCKPVIEEQLGGIEQALARIRMHVQQ